MKNKKLTTYQMAVTALMAAAMCVLGPLTVPIGAVPISLANFVICLTAWLLGPKFGTLSVAVYPCSSALWACRCSPATARALPSWQAPPAAIWWATCCWPSSAVCSSKRARPARSLRHRPCAGRCRPLIRSVLFTGCFKCRLCFFYCFIINVVGNRSFSDCRGSQCGDRCAHSRSRSSPKDIQNFRGLLRQSLKP